MMMVTRAIITTWMREKEKERKINIIRGKHFFSHPFWISSLNLSCREEKEKRNLRERERVKG